jgi:molybdopterin-containing oxidoreductase family iron-sulfur binding subunit
MTRFAMGFDLNRCIGCWACAVACKSENSVADGVWWQEVDTVGGASRDTSVGVFPDVSKHYRPRNCFHCADPPCLPACPEGAISKRADGIVTIDATACTGCGDCVPACPYDAISLNPDEPKLSPGLEAGHGAAEVPPRGPRVAEKCSYCVHRVDQGREPACVAACPTGVIAFGDAEEPTSSIAAMARRHDAEPPRDEAVAGPSAWVVAFSIGEKQRRSGGD